MPQGPDVLLAHAAAAREAIASEILRLKWLAAAGLRLGAGSEVAGDTQAMRRLFLDSPGQGLS
jgi:hypothetical protein